MASDPVSTRDQADEPMSRRRTTCGQAAERRTSVPPFGTTLVPTATSNVSMASTTVDDVDVTDAHGRIYT